MLVEDSKKFVNDNIVHQLYKSVDSLWAIIDEKTEVVKKIAIEKTGELKRIVTDKFK